MSDNAHFIFVLLSIKLCLLLFIGSSLIICHCPLNNVRLILVLFCRSQRHFLLWLLFPKELLIMSVILNMMTTICFVWFSVKIGRRRKKIYFVEYVQRYFQEGDTGLWWGDWQTISLRFQKNFYELDKVGQLFLVRFFL